MRAAIKHADEDGDYDQVYCVFDRDGHPSFSQAINYIQDINNSKKYSYKIESIHSIPCFEFWVLLHFENTDRNFSSQGELQRHVLEKGYLKSKSQKNIFHVLKPFLLGNQGALERAQSVAKKALQHGQECSVTNVHKLVKCLLTLKTLPDENEVKSS